VVDTSWPDDLTSAKKFLVMSKKLDIKTLTFSFELMELP